MIWGYDAVHSPAYDIHPVPYATAVANIVTGRSPFITKTAKGSSAFTLTVNAQFALPNGRRNPRS